MLAIRVPTTALEAAMAQGIPGDDVEDLIPSMM
jgi:hypothetical protein